MNKNWPTKFKDIAEAHQIIEQIAYQNKDHTLGLFELVFNKAEKKMGIKLSHWVSVLAAHFSAEYGPEQGDLITRQVVTNCLLDGETVH